jgi:hypothetical protein
MALTRDTLSRVGPQNSGAPTLWSYASADASATIDGSGYFNGVADLLQVGDWILISISGTSGGIMLVNASTRDLAANPPVSGVVDCSNMVALAAIDSD